MNGSSVFTVEKIIRDKLNPIYDPTILSKDFCNISFMTAHANKLLKFDLGKFISKFYPQIHLILFSLTSFVQVVFFPFQRQDIPCVKSNIIYMHYCGLCPVTYTDESTCHYQTCVSEHGAINGDRCVQHLLSERLRLSA